AESDYVQVITEKGKYLKEQTMKYFEENLLPTKFIRVHRSYIVNVEAISRIELYEKQTQLVTLKNGMQIRMSQSGYKLLKNILKL
ncbi:MAG: LytTR family transcriptional regulator DNA-binding domain-containing protein, partial [Saprospiraceae bacterium]|nr:LytTR family transcriptional regulator DNA-binding domain-containing protein [Saprospiraceae bacterium]